MSLKYRFLCICLKNIRQNYYQVNLNLTPKQLQLTSKCRTYIDKKDLAENVWPAWAARTTTQSLYFWNRTKKEKRKNLNWSLALIRIKQAMTIHLMKLSLVRLSWKRDQRYWIEEIKDLTKSGNLVYWEIKIWSVKLKAALEQQKEEHLFSQNIPNLYKMAWKAKFNCWIGLRSELIYIFSYMSPPYIGYNYLDLWIYTITPQCRNSFLIVFAPYPRQIPACWFWAGSWWDLSWKWSPACSKICSYRPQGLGVS